MARDLALFVLLSVLWGGSFAAIEVGLAYFPPITYAAVRFLLAGLLLLGVVAATADYWRPRTVVDGLDVAASGGLIIAGFTALLYLGQQFVPSGVAAILISTNAVLTAGVSRLVVGERLPADGLVGLGVGLVGVGLIVQPDPGNLLAADVRGRLLVLAAACCTAVGSVVSQRLDSPLPTRATVAWASLLGCLLLFLATVPLPGESLAAVDWTLPAALSLAYLVVFATAGGYLVYFRLLGRIGAVDINLISYSAPVVAALVGWLLLGERLGAATVAGFLAILVGFLLLKRREIEALSAA